jgi:uncharacterized protein
MTIIEEALNVASEYMQGYDESHNMDHIDRVCKNVDDIIAGEGIELTERELIITKIITIFHEMYDSKYSSLQTPQRKMLVYDFYARYFNIDEIELIDRTVRLISYSKEVRDGVKEPDNIYCNIVTSADRLDALGEFGLQRCIQYGQAVYPQYSTDEQWQRVYDHCYEKLLGLHKHIRIPWARDKAIEETKIIQDFVAEWEKSVAIDNK